MGCPPDTGTPPRGSFEPEPVMGYTVPDFRPRPETGTNQHVQET